MALYLVQHGQCHPKTVDPEKGLTEEGHAAATRIAGVAQGYGVPVTCILHSGKKRARQTAEIFETALAPPEGLHTKSGLNPLDDVTALAGLIDSKENLMLVGHLPFHGAALFLAGDRRPGSAGVSVSKRRHCLPEAPSRDAEPDHCLDLDARNRLRMPPQKKLPGLTPPLAMASKTIGCNIERKCFRARMDYL